MKKNVLIYGLGRSGRSSIDFLINKKTTVFVYDDNPLVLEKYCDKPVVKLFNLDEIKKIDFDQVVVSPGVDECTTVYSYLIERYKLISEIELGFHDMKGTLIAVTGTNGKTTTVNLVHHILKSYGKSSYLVGNVGTPITSLKNMVTAKDNIVCEVSSFQLMTTKTFKPKISAILNISPDHLDRHKTLKNYIEAKENIFTNQSKNDYCILNYDDINALTLKDKPSAQLIYFSMQNQLMNQNFRGAFMAFGCIFYREKYLHLVMPINQIKLLGDKNLENVLCAVCIAKLLKIDNDSLRKAINSFEPLPNRLEKVLTHQNITYINDSKATNIDSCLCDCRAIKSKCVLLLGGSDKGEDFKMLFSSLPNNVLDVVVYGETQENMKECARAVSFENVTSAKQLSDAFPVAVKMAQHYAEINDTETIVLLAPACASFDEFANYEERGSVFKKLVREYCGE